MIIATIFIALKLVVHYHLLGYGLVAIIMMNVIQKNQKKMIATSIGFLLSAVLIIGIPMGVIKTFYPEIAKEEHQVIEEVQSWIG